MAYQSFKDLRVWQEARELAISIYGLTASGKLAKDFGLREQMQKAAVSTASNIAEGYERNSDKDFIRFLMIAKGSLSELRTQLDIAHGIGYLEQGVFVSLEDRSVKLGAMLTKLIKARQRNAK
jgi:four helix bundle protein